MLIGSRLHCIDIHDYYRTFSLKSRTHCPKFNLQIQAADRLVKEALKNIPEEGSTEQMRQKLKVSYFS